MCYDYSPWWMMNSKHEPWSGGFTSITFGDLFADKSKTTLLLIGIIVIVIVKMFKNLQML
jgi:hypothetical protein